VISKAVDICVRAMSDRRLEIILES